MLSYQYTISKSKHEFLKIRLIFTKVACLFRNLSGLAYRTKLGSYLPLRTFKLFNE